MPSAANPALRPRNACVFLVTRRNTGTVCTVKMRRRLGAVGRARRTGVQKRSIARPTSTSGRRSHICGQPVCGIKATRTSERHLANCVSLCWNTRSTTAPPTTITDSSGTPRSLPPASRRLSRRSSSRRSRRKKTRGKRARPTRRRTKHQTRAREQGKQHPRIRRVKVTRNRRRRGRGPAETHAQKSD